MSNQASVVRTHGDPFLHMLVVVIALMAPVNVGFALYFGTTVLTVTFGVLAVLSLAGAAFTRTVLVRDAIDYAGRTSRP